MVSNVATASALSPRAVNTIRACSVISGSAFYRRSAYRACVVFLEPKDDTVIVKPVLARQKRCNFANLDFVYTNRAFCLAVVQEICIYGAPFKLRKRVLCSWRRSIALRARHHLSSEADIQTYCERCSQQVQKH